MIPNGFERWPDEAQQAWIDQECSRREREWWSFERLFLAAWCVVFASPFVHAALFLLGRVLWGGP